MGAWGWGLFQSDHDLDIIYELTEEAGVNESRKKQRESSAKTTDGDRWRLIEIIEVDNAFFVQTRPLEDEDEDKERNSIYKPRDLEFVRNHLDSGVLVRMLEKYETALLTGEETSLRGAVPGYVFMLLGACGMTCGCTIPKTYKSTMQKVCTAVELPSEAIQQIKKALNGPNGFKDGEPYDFKSQGLIEKLEGPRPPGAIMNHKGEFTLNVQGPGTEYYQPPKGSTKGLEELKAAKANEIKHAAADVCAGCGATEKDGAGALFACRRCGARKYCSRECQKKQWHFHQRVCAVSASGKKNEKQ